MSELSHTLESYKTKTTDQHTSTINILQQKLKHTSSHKTKYYIEETNEAENYDVERKKLERSYTKKKNKFMGERRYRKLIGTKM